MNRERNIQTLINTIRESIDNKESISITRVEILCNTIESLSQEQKSIKECIINMLKSSKIDEDGNLILDKNKVETLNKLIEAI